MALEYAKVLQSLNLNFNIIGRGEKKCSEFYSSTGLRPFQGGLEAFLNTSPDFPDFVINAVGIDQLTCTTQALLNYGVKNILVEKPGFAYPVELNETLELVVKKNANVLLAYNRRFYSSVIRAKEYIEKDGGVRSFQFEFTEWSHSIEKLDKHISEHENWFYGNSSHLIDLAFFLGGKPIELSTFKRGGLKWHPDGEIYAGSGRTQTNALFSYIANWSSPGRWSLELCTQNFRLVFKPIEELQIMKIGSVAIEKDFSYDSQDDILFKPGLVKMIKSYLNNDTKYFKNIKEMHEDILDIYQKIQF